MFEWGVFWRFCGLGFVMGVIGMFVALRSVDPLLNSGRGVVVVLNWGDWRLKRS